MGQFQLGNPGRPKGSKNKFKVLSVRDYLEQNGIDPIKKVMELMPIIEYKAPEQAARIWLAIQQWVDPRVQKIENIGERNSSEPTGFEKRADGHLLEILQPKKAANDK